MTTTILVTGATGKLGQRVVNRLLQKQTKVRVLTRRPEEALKLWGDTVDIAAGNFSDPVSLKEASCGIDRVLAAAPQGDHSEGDKTWR